MAHLKFMLVLIIGLTLFTGCGEEVEETDSGSAIPTISADCGGESCM